MRYIPFPYMIVSILVFMFILVLYCSNGVLIIPLSKSSFGILVMLCSITTLIVFILSKIINDDGISSMRIIFIVLIGGGTGIMFIMNIVVSILYIINI